jgi:hypothetical protein
MESAYGQANTATINVSATNGKMESAFAKANTVPTASSLTGSTLASGITASSLTSFGASIALGTPGSGNLSNCTFPTLNQNTTGTAAGLSSTLAVASGGTGVTSSTGSGSVVLNSSPTLVSPALGTPSSGNLSNCSFPTLNQNTTGTATNATNLSGGGTFSVTAGTITSTTPTLTFVDTDHSNFYVHVNGNSWHVLNNSSTAIIYTDSSGNFTAVGNVTAYSDRKLKKNIVTIDGALNKVSNLRGVYYNRIDDEADTRKTGVIAQEIQEILPEVVKSNKDLKTGEEILSVDYGNIVGILIEAIKELKSEVDVLKGKIK